MQLDIHSVCPDAERGISCLLPQLHNELKGVCQNSTEVWDAIPVYSHMCQKYVWFLWVHSMCMWPGSGVTIVSMRKDQDSNISLVWKHIMYLVVVALHARDLFQSPTQQLHPSSIITAEATSSYGAGFISSHDLQKNC